MAKSSERGKTSQDLLDNSPEHGICQLDFPNINKSIDGINPELVTYMDGKISDNVVLDLSFLRIVLEGDSEFFLDLQVFDDELSVLESNLGSNYFEKKIYDNFGPVKYREHFNPVNQFNKLVNLAEIDQELDLYYPDILEYDVHEWLNDEDFDNEYTRRVKDRLEQLINVLNDIAEPLPVQDKKHSYNLEDSAIYDIAKREINGRETEDDLAILTYDSDFAGDRYEDISAHIPKHFLHTYQRENK